MENGRILICEDERLVAQDLKAQLEQFGYVVTGMAVSGEEAIELAERCKPDLALMDIRLDGHLAGTDVATILAQEYGIPSIYLTAYSDDATFEEAKATEPLGYLLKPVGERELKTTIELGLYLQRKQKTLKHEMERSAKQLEEAFQRVGLNPKDYNIGRHLAEIEKVETIRTIAAGIAHHLNNSLASVVAALDWLKHCKTIPEFEARFVHAALAGCDNVALLIQQLLWASGQGLTFYEFRSIQSILGEVLSELKKEVSEQVEFHLIAPPEPLVILADRRALKQALASVLLNAYEATEKPGDVTIGITCEYQEIPEKSNPHAQPGWYVVVKVRDTGGGMSEDVLEKVQSPFFTTHGDDSRVGMGLAVVHGVMEALGGWINIDSHEGAGTTVTLYLPRAQQESAIAPKKEEQLDQKMALLLSGDAVDGEVLEETMEKLGLKAVTFARVSDAVRWYTAHHASVSVVLIDSEIGLGESEVCLKHISRITPHKGVALIVTKNGEPLPRFFQKGTRIFERPLSSKEIGEWASHIIEALPH